jgi:hypothetical protein
MPSASPKRTGATRSVQASLPATRRLLPVSPFPSQPDTSGAPLPRSHWIPTATGGTKSRSPPVTWLGSMGSCVRLTLRHFGGDDGPPTDGTRGGGPDGQQYAHRRVGAGLEPARGWSTARNHAQRTAAKNRLNMVGSVRSGGSRTHEEPPNQSLDLTGAAIPVSRDIRLLQAARQVSFSVTTAKGLLRFGFVPDDGLTRH